MVDPVPTASSFPQDYVRQTTHRAVIQSPNQPQPATQPIDTYQPPQTQKTAPLVQPFEPAVPQFQPLPPTQPVAQPATQAAPTASVQQSTVFPGVPKPQPEITVLEWEAPSRPFKPRKRQYFTTVILIAVLISLILFFANQFLPIAVVIAVAFLSYVLAVVPPGIIKHSLTTYGVRIEGQLYYWEELGRFWFSTKHGQNVLHIEVSRFPWRLSLLLGTISVEDMSTILSEVLLKQKPPLSPMEKAAEWLQEKIPLDSD